MVFAVVSVGFEVILLVCILVRIRLRYELRVKSTCLLLQGDSCVSKPDLKVMRYALTCPRLSRSARAGVYQALYFDSTAMFTV